MKLLTKAILKKLPKLGETDGKNPKVIVKFFDPTSNWTWYITEYDGDDTLYGLVEGLEKELCYISLSELENARGKFGVEIQRDMYFKPQLLSNFK